MAFTAGLELNKPNAQSVTLTLTLVFISTTGYNLDKFLICNLF